jgi:hypothetical protein
MQTAVKHVQCHCLPLSLLAVQFAWAAALTLSETIVLRCVLWLCLQDELYLNGAVVLPHKEIKEAVPSPNIIL